jgi:hypothetical protein
MSQAQVPYERQVVLRAVKRSQAARKEEVLMVEQERDEARAAPRWCGEPPITPGVYWWRRDGEARVVEVSHPPHGGPVAYFIGGGWAYVHEMLGEWWPEPLVPPGGA